MPLPESMDALTPEIARTIDEALRAHSAAPADAQNAPGAHAIGSLIAGPVIRIVIARLLPVLKTQALNMVDAEVARLQAQYPTLDLSFIHGLVESVFNAISGASSPSPAVGTMGPVS